MPAERHDPYPIPVWCLPLTVKPRSGHHQVGMIWVVLRGMAENLPRAPGVFLVPESGHVQVGHGGLVQLIDPCFFLPVLVIVWVLHGVVPRGQ